MQQEPEYQKFLKDSFSARCEVNSSYSLRAFSRDIGLSVATLSGIFNNKKGLSLEKAQIVAMGLGLNQSEQKLFCDSVVATHSRSKAARELATKSLKQQRENFETHLIDEKKYRHLSNWYLHAILQIIEEQGASQKTDVLAKRLGIKEFLVTEALVILEELELIIKSGNKWKKNHSFTSSKTDIPSAAMRKVTLEMLEKAKVSLASDSIEKREFSTIFMLANPSDLPKFKEELRALRRKFCVENENKKNSELFCFSMQLYPLTKNIPLKEKNNEF